MSSTKSASASVRTRCVSVLESAGCADASASSRTTATGRADRSHVDPAARRLERQHAANDCKATFRQDEGSEREKHGEADERRRGM